MRFFYAFSSNHNFIDVYVRYMTQVRRHLKEGHFFVRFFPTLKKNTKKQHIYQREYPFVEETDLYSSLVTILDISVRS